MNNSFELLNVGLSDTVNILSLEQMDDVIGGKSKCKKDFTTYENGTFTCGCGFFTGANITIGGSVSGGTTGGTGTTTGGNDTSSDTIKGTKKE